MSTKTEFPVQRNQIAGLSVHQLAAQFGTPTYLYDAELIVQRVQDLQSFDVVRFAQKACSNIAVVDLVRRHGGLVDAVSAGEIHRALAAGYAPQGDPPPVVYTADVFDRAAMELVLQHNLHVNCGSPDMIDQLGELRPGSNLTLRINPGFGHGHSQKTNTGGPQSKHGIWHEQLPNCAIRAERAGMAITGLHMHIGSGTDLQHLAQVCGAMENAVREIGRSITTISAGGGLSTPYKADQQHVDTGEYFRLWDATRNKLQEELGHAISLEIEPGRYLTAEAGYLLTEIRAIKQMGENTFYLVDAGFNDLARPILYGAYHPMSIAAADGEIRELPLADVVVGGPLCESGDIFTQEEGGYVATRRLPKASVGDFLIIECAGAYGSVMASNYNSKPLAAEVLIQGGAPHLIRKRQTLEQLTENEIIPG